MASRGPTKEDVLAKLTELQAHRTGIDSAKKQLVERARDQYDTMPEAIDLVEQRHARDRAGGVLGQRVMRQLLSEREHLRRIVDDHATT